MAADDLSKLLDGVEQAPPTEREWFGLFCSISTSLDRIADVAEVTLDDSRAVNIEELTAEEPF